MVAQLIYDADAGTTTGSGVLVGHDGFVPWRFWSVGFGQPALNFTGAIANGDVISALRSSGVDVIACNTAVGCSLVTLEDPVGGVRALLARAAPAALQLASPPPEGCA